MPLAQHAVAAPKVQPTTTVTTEIRQVVGLPADEAFGWLDAAVGGATVLGLVLIAAGASAVAARRSRRRVLADIQPIRKEHEK